MSTSDRLLKGFKIYLVFVACLMLAQFFFFELQWIFGWNFNAWLKINHPYYTRRVFHAEGILFFFSIFHIPVCGISGIILLLYRDFRTGIFSLASAACYAALLWQIGDAY
jgi:hypothetical protein